MAIEIFNLLMIYQLFQHEAVILRTQYSDYSSGWTTDATRFK